MSEALVLDGRDLAEFLRGHAPGAAHLPIPEWDERAAELPPREDVFFVVAESEAATLDAVARLHARGSRGARPAPHAVAVDRSESGPARRVAWRPPGWLLDCLDAAALPAGARTLDVACGSGRVVAALAARGFRSTGIDRLPDALTRARRLAAASGVSPSFAIVDAERPLPFRSGAFHLVTGFRYLDRTLFPALAGLVEPGGELWWETFGEAQAQFGHPRRPEFLLSLGELSDLVRHAGFEVLSARETCPPGGPALSAVRARRPLPARLQAGAGAPTLRSAPQRSPALRKEL